MSFESARWQRRLGYGAALLSGLCAGLIWPLNKALSAKFSAGQITWLQALVAVAMLLPWYRVRHRRTLMPRGTPWGWLGLFGLTAVILFYMRTQGVALTNATTASLVVRIEVVLILIYSRVFLHEQPSPWGWVGAGALVGGMVLAMDLPAQQLRVNLWGVGALVVAGVGIASNAIIIKLHLGKVSDDLTALANVCSQAALLPLLLGPLGELGDWGGALRDWQSAGLMVAGGALIPTMLITYYYAIKRVPLWSVRLLNLVAPLLALASDHYWLHSSLSPGQLGGFVLVTAGASLVILSGSRPGLQPEPDDVEVAPCLDLPPVMPPSSPYGKS